MNENVGLLEEIRVLRAECEMLIRIVGCVAEEGADLSDAQTDEPIFGDPEIWASRFQMF